MIDPNRAEYILSFLEMLPFGSGDFAGKPFRLQQWQMDPLQEFYGTLDEDEETGYTGQHDSELVVGSTEEVLDAGFVIDEDSPEGIFDYDDGMDAGDEE